MADKAQKDTKKAAENHDGNQSDSHDPTGDIECETCGISFSDPQAYEKHMQGKKHQKRVAEAKLRAKNLDKEALLPESDEDEEEDDDDPHCDVCRKSFSGYLAYLAHVKGGVHAKNVKQKKLKHQLRDMPEVLDKDGGHSDDDDDSILPKAYARCNHCQKEFSGPEPYKMHLKSAVHKKKVKQAQVAETLKTHGDNDETKHSDDEEPFSKCDVCQKSFSGVVPYKIHMESAAHKKSVEKKKVADELKEFFVEDDADPGYVCKECKKSFTDPMAFKCHLEKNSHERQKAKSALMEFLNAHPEIVMAYPFEDESDDDEDAANKYFLICKLCHVSFSGPESAKDHVKSKKHISLRKEKKMAKLIKDQQKGKSEEEESSGKKQQNDAENKLPTTKTDDKKTQVSKDNKQSEISENGKRVRQNSEGHDFELI